MSALGAIEAAESDEVAAGRGARLRLVPAPRPAGSGRASSAPAGVSHPASGPRAGVSRPPFAPPAGVLHATVEPQAAASARTGTALTGTAPRTGTAPGPRPMAGLAPAPLRLTRRGRLVLAALALFLATIAITVASMTVSGAQAANHGRSGGGYAGMHQIVVRPGQTLWSIAVQAEPTADPRQVVGQIMTANSMTSSVVQAGELLWVPK
jgi:nucleoid-associated protein YgaU